MEYSSHSVACVSQQLKAARFSSAFIGFPAPPLHTVKPHLTSTSILYLGSCMIDTNRKEGKCKWTRWKCGNLLNLAKKITHSAEIV